VFEVITMGSACLVDFLSEGFVAGLELPAVAFSPDVTFDEIRYSFDEHR
jgi:hypothetical protein